MALYMIKRKSYERERGYGKKRGRFESQCKGRPRGQTLAIIHTPIAKARHNTVEVSTQAEEKSRVRRENRGRIPDNLNVFMIGRSRRTRVRK